MPPDVAVLLRFAEPAGRASWPLRDPASVAALELLAGGVDQDRTRAEWERLFGGGPAALDLTESGNLGEPAERLRRELAGHYRTAGLGEEAFEGAPADHLGRELRYLAHLVGELARDESVERLRDEISGFTREHCDRYRGRVLERIQERAEEPLWRALPGLAEGFCNHVTALAL